MLSFPSMVRDSEPCPTPASKHLKAWLQCEPVTDAYLIIIGSTGASLPPDSFANLTLNSRVRSPAGPGGTSIAIGLLEDSWYPNDEMSSISWCTWFDDTPSPSRFCSCTPIYAHGIFTSAARPFCFRKAINLAIPWTNPPVSQALMKPSMVSATASNIASATTNNWMPSSGPKLQIYININTNSKYEICLPYTNATWPQKGMYMQSECKTTCTCKYISKCPGEVTKHSSNWNAKWPKHAKTNHRNYQQFQNSP